MRQNRFFVSNSGISVKIIFGTQIVNKLVYQNKWGRLQEDMLLTVI